VIDLAAASLMRSFGGVLCLDEDDFPLVSHPPGLFSE